MTLPFMLAPEARNVRIVQRHIPHETIRIPLAREIIFGSSTQGSREYFAKAIRITIVPWRLNPP